MNFLSVSEKFHQLVYFLIEHQITIATMESCTGGLLASLLTDSQGASAVFYGSFISYTNDAKILCGIKPDIIRQYGVYSKETAIAMAENCCNHYHTNIGIGVTGTFANPDPNNQDSIAGIVYFVIVFQEKAYDFRIELPQLENRFSYKLTVCNFICDALDNILKEALI